MEIGFFRLTRLSRGVGRELRKKSGRSLAIPVNQDIDSVWLSKSLEGEQDGASLRRLFRTHVSV